MMTNCIIRIQLLSCRNEFYCCIWERSIINNNYYVLINLDWVSVRDSFHSHNHIEMTPMIL